MKLLDILKKAKIDCPSHLIDVEVEGITSRSEDVREGFVFVCLKGTKTDGHSYIGKALEQGACAIVIEDEKYIGYNTVSTESTRKALSNMLDAFYGEPSKRLNFIAVTGTNGKTSVAEMIKCILVKSNISCEVIGTLDHLSFPKASNALQTHLTTPDPEELYPMLLRIAESGASFVIMEASSHALKLKKLEPIKFEIGIFTNLTEDHLDFHKTMEDYFKSKLELFNKCRLGIINIDGEYGKRIINEAPCMIKTCSMHENADYTAKNINEHYEKGSGYTLTYGTKALDIEIKMPGKFSILNSMQACACALELNIDNEIIKQTLKEFSGASGRLEKIDFFKEYGISVFIDYAHTPDALSKLIDTAASFKKNGGKIILVFGCGGNREKEKRAKMGEIAAKNSFLAIVTNDNPRNENPMDIINDIVSGMKGYSNYAVIPDRRKAIAYAIATAKHDDIVLLAGKGHEKYEINALGTSPFDEREVLREIYKNYKEE